jgi:hypothetical protein
LQKSGAARRKAAPQRSQGTHGGQVRHHGMIIAGILALRKKMSANSRIPQSGSALRQWRHEKVAAEIDMHAEMPSSDDSAKTGYRLIRVRAQSAWPDSA